MRPQVETAEGALPLEAFQNDTLRPVIKMQHEVILRAWHRYVLEQKGKFYKLNRPDQEAYIRHSYQTNRAFRAFNLGLVCGVLTKVEWETFKLHEKELSKRVYNLVAQRVGSSAEAYTSGGYTHT
ncbi:MAG: hypothetical protein AB8F78_02125 [Saprospiraceae bacterium]